MTLSALGPPSDETAGFPMTADGQPAPVRPWCQIAVCPQRSQGYRQARVLRFQKKGFFDPEKGNARLALGLVGGREGGELRPEHRGRSYAQVTA